MREYIELGSTPYNEDCVQVSKDGGYEHDMMKECLEYCNMLTMRYINLPDNMYFSVKCLVS